MKTLNLKTSNNNKSTRKTQIHETMTILSNRKRKQRICKCAEILSWRSFKNKE